MSEKQNTRPAITWVSNQTAYRYVVTPMDEKWFIKCIWREGKPYNAVGFTLLQRFAALYSTNRPYGTLTDFLRAYCQPINPRWLPDGDLHKARVNRLRVQGRDSDAEREIERAKKRAEYVATPISKIPSKYRKKAYEILSGTTLSPVPNATHFTSSFATQSDDQESAKQKAIAFGKKKNLSLVEIPEGYKKGINWFFSGPGKTIPPKIDFSSAIWVSSFFFALFALPALFFLWRKAKA